ncbi:MAG TPA: IPT/TIG domain-containing protein, partial [Pseudonocardiaceae bacterium]
VASVPGPASFAYDAAGRLAGVVNAAGEVARYTYDAAGNVTGVQRLGAPAVAVLSVVPQRARPGDRLTVSGSGFAGTPAGNTVTINGVAASVTEAGDRRLTVTVPDSATTGDLRVDTGAGSATHPVTVIVGDRPVVSGFTPAVATPGTTVTVSVSNTDPAYANNLVRINGLLATVTARDAGTLTVTVPPGAASGRVSVSTPAGTGEAAGVLVVPPSGVPPESVDPGPITVGTRTAVPLAAGRYALRHFEAADGDRFAVLLDGGTLSSCSVTATLYDERNRSAGSASCVGVSGWVDTTARSGPGLRSLVLRNTGATAGTLYATVLRVPDDVDAGVQALDGTPLVLTVPDPGRSAFSTFTGTAGTRVIVQSSAASSSFGCCYLRWRVIAPDGSTVGAAQNPNAVQDTVALPADGTYRIVMDPDGARVGSMTVAAWTVPADVHAGTQALDGSPLTLTIPTPGNVAYSTFEGTTGQRVIIQSSASSSSFGCCYMSWRLLAPNGATVGAAQSPNGVQDTIALPQDGTYRIVMNPDGTRVGSTTIAAWNVPADIDAGTQALDGTPLTLAIPSPGNVAYSTFEGTTGQRVIIQSSASSSSFGCCYMSWRLLAPNGATVGAAQSPNGVQDTVALPQDGTYRIVMNPDGTRVGSTTVAAWNVPADVDAGAQALDGTPVVLGISTPGTVAYSTFEATTGQRVIIRSSASSSSFGCCYMSWRLLAPNGATVGAAQSPNGVQDTVTLPQTGTYRIVMNPDGTRVGSTTIAAWNVPADADAGTQPLDGTPLVLTVANPGTVTFSSFTGTTGQSLTVRSSASSPAFGCCYMTWRLFAPNGAQVGSTRSPNQTLTVTLPQSGPYRLVVNPDGVLVGSTTLTATVAAVLATAAEVEAARAELAARPAPRPAGTG